MSFLTTLEYMFGTQDLYAVLGVNKAWSDRTEAVQTAFDRKARRYQGNNKKYKVRLLCILIRFDLLVWRVTRRDANSLAIFIPRGFWESRNGNLSFLGDRGN